MHRVGAHFEKKIRLYCNIFIIFTMFVTLLLFFMKKFKVIFSTTIIFLMIVSSFIFNACNQDPCKDISCKNNGTCRDGACKCAVGFEGPFCETKMYEKFIGTYDGYYRCNGLIPELKTLVITPEAQSNKVTIYYLFENAQEVIAATIELENSNEINLEQQTVGNFVYTGNGFIKDNDITLFIQQLNLTDSVYNTCTYNGVKFIE